MYSVTRESVLGVSVTVMVPIAGDAMTFPVAPSICLMAASIAVQTDRPVKPTPVLLLELPFCVLLLPPLPAFEADSTLVVKRVSPGKAAIRNVLESSR